MPGERTEVSAHGAGVGGDPDAPQAFGGPGEMRARCRAFDWAATPLGPIGTWPSSLRTTAETVLAMGFPAIVLWGPDLIQLYNDAYIPFLGARHPAGLGMPARACWPEIWPLVQPVIERVRAGETVTLADHPYPLLRRRPGAAPEDVYVTLTHVPVRDETDAVGGVLVTGMDTTAQVVGEATRAERERLEARLHGVLLETALVLDQVRDAYLVLDDAFRIVAVNQSAERALGMPRAALLGATSREAFPGSAGAEPERQFRRVAAERVEAHFVHHHVHEDQDAHLEIDAYPAREGGVAVFWRDISERTRLHADAEIARADAEARAATLAAVIDSIPDAVLVGRADAVTLANPAALQQLGVPSVAALGSGSSGTAPPLDGLLLDRDTGAVLPLAATPIGRAFAGERSHGLFLLHARGTGETRPVRAVAAPIRGPDGAILGVVSVLTDMTRTEAAAAERDRLLAELEAERTLLRTVLDQLPVAVFIVEAPSGRVLALNDAVARVWGETRPRTHTVEQYSAEWVGYHLDGRRIASHEWPVARAAAGETVIDWVGEIERADGARVLIEVSAAPVRDAGGRTVAAVAVAADITARARATQEREHLLQALELERARLAYVFEHAPTFLAVVRGPTHVCELANAAFEQLVGHRPLVGRPVREALPEVVEQGFVALLDHVLATGEAHVGREVSIFLSRTPGAPLEERFVDFVYLPLVEADGTRSGVIAHGTDVTEQVVARREIERLLHESERARADAEAARADAEGANRAKAEFLAVMSHELRTPLNAIGGYAELMELGIRGPVTPLQRDDLARIQKSQRHLLGLITGVLNYARAEAGAVHYDVRDVPLAPVLVTCETLVAPQAQAKQIALAFDACSPRVTARGDRDKVQQIVINLLSNAVKFTEPGGAVTVSCRPDRRDGAHPVVLVQVVDTGRGIAPDALERVFEAFVQVDTRLTRTQEGIGLGLAISRDLARGMGGDLVVESTMGTGSTFTLTLPAA